MLASKTGNASYILSDMIKAIVYTFSFFLILTVAHFKTQKRAKIFLPLGDSYTIGTGVAENESWPQQLCLKLKESGIEYRLPINPARIGSTTADLIRDELPLLKKRSKPDLISLLIGVNDWVQGIDGQTFRKNLVTILNEMERHLNTKGQIIIITIPDFGKTPAGKRYARGRDISKGISEFNTIIKEEATKRNLMITDIFSLSQLMESDSSLVAGDGLHPSAKEYALWVELILTNMLQEHK
ncbi:MAG: hypothetical protein JNL60_17785 [Bacteroidia bacterium]|nr:hypothetical protein [Bacteroidia bacterium]